MRRAYKKGSIMKIITLTLSPAFDIHCSGDELIVNHENIATVTDNDAGGKGINISRALTVFGIKNTAVAILGEENGDSFARAVRADGIDLLVIPDKGRIRENITLHTKDGKETRLSFTGTGTSDGVFDMVKEKISEIADENTVLTVTGRVPDGISIASVKEMIKDLKKRGVRIVVDSRSFTIADLIEVSPYLIKPNEEEIVTYVQKKVSGVADAISAARDLYNKGIENVMVSLGALGAVIVSQSGIYHAKAPSIAAVSTIGAGDSSIAGFIMGMALGEDAEHCLRRAVAFGTGACMTAGTKPPRKSDVLDLIEKIESSKQ